MADLSKPVWEYRFELSPGKWVYVPDPDTKAYGADLKEKVAAAWNHPRYFYHLGPGGHLAALKSHWHHAYFARADIENFFGNVTKTRVTRHLRKLFGYARAREMAVMSVVPNDDKTRFVLPFGFPQSSILASLCLHKSKLGRFLKNLPGDITASVYVDDIIISTDVSVGYLQEAFDEMVAKAEESGLRFGDSKRYPPSDNVSAFNIILNSGWLALEDERFVRFRDRIIDPDGIEENAHDGILGYVRQINPDQYHQLTTYPYKPK